MADAAVTPAEVHEALRRVLDSATFRGADRSSRLLHFIVEEALEGRTDRLKDYTLGAEVLGRGERFDPRLDPIARVEASRLRARLERHYATDGATDTLVIGLPKGGYVPTFTPRAAVPLPAEAPQGSDWWRPVAAVSLAALAVFTGLIAWRTSTRAASVAEVTLELTTPPTTDPVSVAISPDGRSLVFVASAEGRPRLWLRPLDATTARPLAGTDYPSFPFWAPDSRSLGFFADGKVKRIDIDSGVIRALASAAVPAGASWSADGTIVFTLVPDGPLFRTTADGADPVPATTLAPGQTGHRAPSVLPDGRHFLFYAMGTADVRGVYIGDLASPSVARLVDADSGGVLARPDRLLHVQHGVLFASHFDLDRQSVVGDPQPIANDIALDAASGIAALSASVGGPIVYRTGTAGGERQFIWVDRSGTTIERLGTPETGGPGYSSLSPDRRHVALQRTVAGNTDIWVLDAGRGTYERFTSEPEPDIAALWSPSGDRIVYSTLKDGAFQLFSQPTNGTDRSLVLSTPDSKQATDWSRDGRYLLFRTVTLVPRSNMDIWAMALDGTPPFPVVRTTAEERDAQFSPDGRWVAYGSDDSGRHEIYVAPFQRAGERTRISTGGGVQARWRSDGRELFYLTLDGQLVAVSVTLAADGDTVRAGEPTPLFRAPIGSPLGISLHKYLVAPDGSRFLLDSVVEAPATPITVVVNWTPR